MKNSCRICFESIQGGIAEESSSITADFRWKFQEITNYEVNKFFTADFHEF